MILSEHTPPRQGAKTQAEIDAGREMLVRAVRYGTIRLDYEGAWFDRLCADVEADRLPPRRLLELLDAIAARQEGGE